MSKEVMKVVDVSCDICRKEVRLFIERLSHDIPDKWVRYWEHGDYSNHEYHACDECKDQIVDGHRVLRGNR